MIERAVYELLKTLASGKVYAMRAKQGDNGPFIVYQITDSEPWRAINGPSGIVQSYFQVDCYASTYFAARDLFRQAAVILDGYRGTVAYGTDSPQDTIKIGGISRQSDVDMFDETDEPHLYRVYGSFLATYEGV